MGRCGEGVALLLLALGTLACALPAPFPVVVEVNFQPENVAKCGAEQFVDSGKGLGPRKGDLFYGWVHAGTDNAVDAEGSRSRGYAGVTCVENTLMHMQYDDCCKGQPNGYQGSLEWEFHVPDGRYRITAIMGDANKDSTYFLREAYSGTVILGTRVPLFSPQFFTGSAEVAVDGSKIRLSAEGEGVNAKINFVRIERLDQSASSSGALDTAAALMSGPCVPIPSQFEGESISPLACSQVVVELPFRLNFDGKQIGVKDRLGKSTGLRMFVPSSRLRNPYLKARVVLNTVTRELAIVGHPGSWERSTNTVRNALGVGLPLPTRAIRLQVTVVMPKPPFWTGGERFCIFTAVSDKEFAWLCVIKRKGCYRLRLHYEAEDQQLQAAVSRKLHLWPDREITLTMDIYPDRDEIRTFFQIKNRRQWPFKTLSVQPLTLNKDRAGTDADLGSRTNGGFVALVPRGWGEVQPTFRVRGFEAAEIAPPVTPLDRPGEPDFDTWRISDVLEPTSLVWASGRLWVANAMGLVYAMTFHADGKSVTDRRTLQPIGSRLLLGITVDPDYDTNGCLWLSHSSVSRTSGEANSGTISRMCGVNLEQREDVITGLPRAIANHANNNLWFHDGLLYVAVGSNTGSGAPNTIEDAAFSSRPEQFLSAAILVADISTPGFIGDCTPAQHPDQMDATGIADEQAPACDVKVYASGVRNVFSCVQHSNGNLYCPDNAIGGKGTFPVLPPGYQNGDACHGIVDGDDIAIHDPGVRHDPLHLIREGQYYGHPNPARRECIMTGGNPSVGPDIAAPRMPLSENASSTTKERSYPVGTQPDPRFQPPIAFFGKNRSPNGVIEYCSNALYRRIQGQAARNLVLNRPASALSGA